MSFEIPLASYILFIGFLFLWIAYEIYPKKDDEPSETERRTQEYDDAREEELSLDLVTGDIVLTPKEQDERSVEE